MRYGTNYSSSARIRCQLAAWLNQYDWDWFATITFREEIETVTARGRVRAFLQTIERTYKRHVGAFIVYEMHKYRGDDPRRRLIPHVHMLVANVHDVYRRWAWSVCFQRNGRTRIEPFKKDLGAAYYVTKYVTKEIFGRGDWDVWGDWVPLSEPRKFAWRCPGCGKFTAECCPRLAIDDDHAYTKEVNIDGELENDSGEP